MKIILGITGSIASYKGLLLSRELFKRGIKQKVILTHSALKFIRPLSFKAITDAEVYTPKHFFKSNLHIEIARWGDILLVSPASANFISKFANGIADNLLLAIAISFKGRIILAPAMHDEMWKNTFIKENVEKLRRNGIEILNPVYGQLASGELGEGRMVEVEDILNYLFSKKKNVLLVYGRTEEKIDDVRVITNRSSGRMGYLIHKALESNGINHDIIVCGSVDFLPDKNFIKVYNTQELLETLKKNIKNYDVLIMPVAISDFISDKIEGKLHRKYGNVKITLKPNIDVLKEISKLKENKIFIGFALEDESKIEENTKEKLKEKNLDFIVANTLESMNSENITGFIMDKNLNKVFEFKNLDKFEVAKKIVELINK
ncbi:MAG: bifunctional phosphopantothenoylcysteine decarboxylase/phosphopantothenate--cysteine ligase CoaBC [candidate division WOR-3 bacterium]